MEIFWYIIAALGAGIGTGLAGLSAATVMVPILIVLCPSFAGETGAYHATAIALASDILGSAVTAGIYMKHKNIDLRRGWIMLTCIVSMCIAGSIAAWHAGHVVLGTFSLFLTFFIGIRFLVKPDTQRKDAASGGRLDAKGIAVSLFFGLTIGFGTGFFGSGGGMMMLVVFTAFLGMERRAAVGTSTFIMTFTALIASVSHILVDPAIALERWDALLICIAVATPASLISAQFANRVSGRIVGLVTGAVLTLLGGFMLILHYREWLAANALVMGIAATFGKYLLYLAAFVGFLLLLRLIFKIPSELWRKLLHTVAYTSSLFMLAVSEDWRVPALCCVIFGVVVYPILQAVEGWRGYDRLFVQRSRGETKKSLLLLFFSHAILITLFAGLAGKPYIVWASVLMWGVGDTFAALIGKRFGRHRIRLPGADGKKTWEGSTAMAVMAFIAGFAALMVFRPDMLAGNLITALIAAPVASATELYSHGGNDTVTVAGVTAVLLLGLSFVL